MDATEKDLEEYAMKLANEWCNTAQAAYDDQRQWEEPLFPHLTISRQVQALAVAIADDLIDKGVV